LHNQLRLQLARLELKGTQEDQKHVYTSKLAPNWKTRIMTTLHQFRDKAARYWAFAVMLGSAIVYFAVSLATKPLSKEKLAKLFPTKQNRQH
jgi:hypothetical protein